MQSDPPRICPLCGEAEPVARFDFKPNPTAIYGGECRACYCSDRRGKQKRSERGKRQRAARRVQVFDHYGWSCACCGSTEDLAIDHVDGDGARHREEVDAERLYAWLIENGFPEGFQTLCKPCNSSKGRFAHCGLHPRVAI